MHVLRPYCGSEVWNSDNFIGAAMKSYRLLIRMGNPTKPLHDAGVIKIFPRYDYWMERFPGENGQGYGFGLNPPVGGFLIRLLRDECNWVHSPPLVGNPPFGAAAK